MASISGQASGADPSRLQQREAELAEEKKWTAELEGKVLEQQEYLQAYDDTLRQKEEEISDLRGRLMEVRSRMSYQSVFRK